ncbi:PLDc N-terminal domain-containing protein [Microbacterium sp. HD4P20]|uniref:PLDc N-terminal domain-containing protein n=1 Tax=Microbacterium sp. HD4P20 TaxID=2864874 RepID=UPI001C63E615|nr:PLDc N-terminal domain-containing protein [Microbacterium sp. HD4P20]MCP2636565.1 PLDc N-terminal domain-containing protein [Microbacterium sp. HD4P20]
MDRTKTELSRATKAGLGIAGIVQVVFAFLAFWDLANRDAREVRGPKAAWIPAILVNWIGPASYFLFGIRR